MSAAELDKIMEAWAHFDYWFNWHGHWVFDDKSKAEAAWQKHGIDGLPNYPGPRK